MAKDNGPDPGSVKPTARKRTALARESASRVRRASQFTNAAASVLQTENVGLLQPETPIERTYKLRQSDLLSAVDDSTTAKASFALDLADSGLTPYHTATYSRSGRCLLLASAKGHVSVTTWRAATLQTELFLNETVRSATFLHSDQFFATAQRKFAYIYDSSGAQLHVLRNHREPGVLAFLPHHLLLASASASEASHKKLAYTDTSTGSTVAELDFGGKLLKLGAAKDGALNYANGVLHLAHAAGVVTLWSPVVSRPLAQVFTHAGGVRNVAVAPDGRWMVTTGADCKLKIWDLRTYKCSAEWRLPAQTTALRVSQRGLIGLSFGSKVQIWARRGGSGTGSSGDATRNGWETAPYMSEPYPGRKITGLDFCPFEDVLAVCHDQGMSSMVVPGAGEPTFDSRAPNPYETRKQRRENEVRTLLDKLPAASIALDPTFVGGIEKDPTVRLKEIRERTRAANMEKRKKKQDVNRAKGRNKISKRLKRRQANIIDAKRLALQEKLEQERKTRDAAKKLKEKRQRDVEAGVAGGDLGPSPVPDALKRFLPKKDR